MSANPSRAQVAPTISEGFETRKRPPILPKTAQPTLQKRKKTVVPNPLQMLVRSGAVVFKSKMSRKEFHEFVLLNEDFKIERDKFGTITIHPPMTLKSSRQEGIPFTFLSFWALQNPQLGEAFSQNANYSLPDGSEYKADGSWIPNEKLETISDEQYDSITKLVPDFVIETRSKTDSLNDLKKKMANAWMANGVKLAWLIDPKEQKTWIYRVGQTEPEEITGFDKVLSGENLLPGFELDLSKMGRFI